jgi:thymidylate synthase (FAD)
MHGDELKGTFFSVLDHGFVSLVDKMGNDAAIVQAARVSYGSGTKKVSDDRNLIRYLVRANHTSPLEMVEFKFHMRMPIFIARQFIRHRTASANEYSGRYSLMPTIYFTPDEWCSQATNNKQGRADKLDDGLSLKINTKLAEQRELATQNYEWMCEQGAARELARIDLPLSTYTEWYWKIDLHNLLHFLSLRCDGHAQKEIRDYGNVIAGIVKECCPLAFEAWQDYNFGGVKLSRAEWKHVMTWMNDGNFECFHNGVDNDKQFSKREREEFFAKFNERENYNFDLDMTKVKPPEYFEEQGKKAVQK